MKKNSKFIAIIVALLLVAGGTAYSMKSIEPIEEPTIAETQETTETPTETIPVAEESIESAPSTEVTEDAPVVEETVAEQVDEVADGLAETNLTSQTNGENMGEISVEQLEQAKQYTEENKFPTVSQEDLNDISKYAYGHHIMPTEEEKKAAEEASGYKPPESAVGKTEEEALAGNKTAQTAKDAAEKHPLLDGELKWNQNEGGWEAPLTYGETAIVTDRGSMIFK